jgi:serine/threonine protein phosphatase PrpC
MMSRELKISVGQHSDKGRKAANQDFHGVLVPEQPLLGLKGIAIVLADGISSSNVSHIASESAVKSFLTDYYCTSESWSVKHSAQRVLEATNSWLHSQTRRSPYAYEEKDKGYVCTLSAIVLKSATAHIFHIGDSRIYRVAGTTLEQLTEDHRVAVSSEQSYLSRALGINASVEIDYRAIEIATGDIFLLATDGVYEHVSNRFAAKTIHDHRQDLDEAARIIVDEAFRQGSQDNLTVQIVRLDQVPGSGDAGEMLGRPSELPPAPLLEPRMVFDGYRIVRELHGSSRSHIYLAVDTDSDALVAIKTPSIDLRDDPSYLKRFILEEWVARRIDSPHVLKPCAPSRKRNYLYVATEFIDGQTLAQWMIDNPDPELETVRGIVEQIAKGLRAFHRKEMLHQDLRPANVMIDKTGTAKIIDFGATKIAGVAEATPERDDGILGTVQYTAPEYFRGESGSPRSDLFSLGVITYQMLTGKLPYGAQVAQARTKSQLGKLRYSPARSENREIPPWIDGALRKAVHPDPYQRYQSLSEYIFDLRHPNVKYLNTSAAPLIERNPTLFWKCATAILACIVVGLLALQHGVRP